MEISTNAELIKLLDYNIPVSDLVSVVDGDRNLWKENTWRQDYVVKLERPISPQQDTEAVMFRWAPKNTIESVRDSLNIVDHPNLFKIQQINPILYRCLKMAGATEVGRVFIAKLKPGGVVIPHQDYGMYADHFERFHLVLSSDEGNVFFVQDTYGNRESKHMKPGELYWFNHKETHWAKNESSRPRMHLIIDAVSKKHRRERVIV